MQAGLEVLPFDRDRDTVELVLMWRTSFEQGVGVTDPHPVDEQAAFLLDHVVTSHRVLVARDGSGIVGLLAATDESVGQLYVRADRFGEGIGSMLLDLAKRESSGHLWLYTFARNHRALAFYARHGFVEVARGFEPSWQLDDVRMEWTRPVAPPDGSDFTELHQVRKTTTAAPAVGRRQGRLRRSGAAVGDCREGEDLSDQMSKYSSNSCGCGRRRIGSTSLARL